MELLKKYHFFEKNLKIRESSDIRTLLKFSKKSSNQVRPAVIGSRYYSILQSKSTDTKLRNIKKNLRYHFQCIFFSFFSRRWRSISCSFFVEKTSQWGNFDSQFLTEKRRQYFCNNMIFFEVWPCPKEMHKAFKVRP